METLHNKARENILILMNSLRKSFLAVVVTAFTFSAILPATVSAGPFDGSREQACQGADLGGKTGCGGAPGNALADRIKTVVNILSAIVGIAAVIMIIIGGFRYITAAGDSAGISAAKSTILYALIGAVIATLAQVIVRFVLGRF